MTLAAATDALTDLQLDLPGRRDGKVRISWELPDELRLFVTTDRLSVFDRVVHAVPGKGQVLNELAAWWFHRTADIVDNHVVSVPDPNVLVAHAATPLPVEVVVRGAITGVTDTSLWRQYERGSRVLYGHRLPDGLHKNALLSTALITPTTKGQIGGHDAPLSVLDVVADGHVPADLWARVCTVALALFARGQEMAGRAGLILADTKYEFGVDRSGRLLLIDEVHTPDSSRYWDQASYSERIDAAVEPESLDKEIVRRAYADLGYRGEGPLPTLPAEVWTRTSARYVMAYERITGSAFQPGATPAAERIVSNLLKLGIL